MKKYLLATLFLLLVPSVSFASTLTQPQVSAILSLLEAFNVSANVIAIIDQDLTGTANSPQGPVATSTVPVQISQWGYFRTEPVSGAVPTCLSNPTLNVSHSFDSRYLRVQVDYKDVCKIDSSTTYSVRVMQTGVINDVSNPNYLDISKGTLGAPDQSVEQGDPWMDGSDSKQWFEFTFGAHQPILSNVPASVIVKVGNLTSTSTIQ